MYIQTRSIIMSHLSGTYLYTHTVASDCKCTEFFASYSPVAGNLNECCFQLYYVVNVFNKILANLWKILYSGKFSKDLIFGNSEISENINPKATVLGLIFGIVKIRAESSGDQ